MPPTLEWPAESACADRSRPGEVARAREVKLRRMVLGVYGKRQSFRRNISYAQIPIDDPVGLRTLQLVPADDALLVAEFDSLTQVPEAVLNRAVLNKVTHRHR